MIKKCLVWLLSCKLSSKHLAETDVKMTPRRQKWRQNRHTDAMHEGRLTPPHERQHFLAMSGSRKFQSGMQECSFRDKKYLWKIASKGSPYFPSKKLNLIRNAYNQHIKVKQKNYIKSKLPKQNNICQNSRFQIMNYLPCPCKINQLKLIQETSISDDSFSIFNNTYFGKYIVVIL